MKITILCGSLEPGKDGVGDYSRLLAESSNAKGSSVQLIAINDNVDASEMMPSGPLHRYKGNFSDSEISKKILAAIDEWNPDCLSLQFVPFSFHPKGIITQLIPFIVTARKRRKLNIMMHELWVRNEGSTPLKYRLLGLIQKMQITRALKRWVPEMIHTSNRHYQKLLKQCGFPSRELSLYGNMPIALAKDKATLLEEISLQCSLSDKIVLFPFSQHERWQPIALLDRLRGICETKQERLALIQVGRNPTVETHWSKISEYAKAVGWKCAVLREQSDATISQLMQIADWGVSSGSILIARKSGAVLSMLEHGLPVICSSRVHGYDWHDYDESRIIAAELSDAQLLERLETGRQSAPGSQLTDISKQWLSDISSTLE